MNAQTVTLILATLLATLAETPSGEIPAGIAYAALMSACDLDTFNATVAAGQKLGLLERDRSHLLKITDKGRELAKRLPGAK